MGSILHDLDQQVLNLGSVEFTSFLDFESGLCDSEKWQTSSTKIEQITLCCCFFKIVKGVIELKRRWKRWL